MFPHVAAASLAHGRRLVAAPRARTEWRRDLVVQSRTQIIAAVWSWTGSAVQLAPRWLLVVAAATPVVSLMSRRWGGYTKEERCCFPVRMAGSAR